MASHAGGARRGRPEASRRCRGMGQSAARFSERLSDRPEQANQLHLQACGDIRARWGAPPRYPPPHRRPRTAPDVAPPIRSEHAAPWLTRRVAGWAPRMGVEPKCVEVRDLGFRWGSCGQAGRVNFHWATILLPPSVIDYVIVHELAHLIEPHHTPEFWKRVGRALPEYDQRKGWLAEHGGRHVVL